MVGDKVGVLRYHSERGGDTTLSATAASPDRQRGYRIRLAVGALVGGGADPLMRGLLAPNSKAQALVFQTWTSQGLTSTQTVANELCRRLQPSSVCLDTCVRAESVGPVRS